MTEQRTEKERVDTLKKIIDESIKAAMIGYPKARDEMGHADQDRLRDSIKTYAAYDLLRASRDGTISLTFPVQAGTEEHQQREAALEDIRSGLVEFGLTTAPRERFMMDECSVAGRWRILKRGLHEWAYHGRLHWDDLEPQLVLFTKQKRDWWEDKADEMDGDTPAQRLQAMARCNAEMAWDQRRAHDSMKDAVHSYRDNVKDTANEMGEGGWEAQRYARKIFDAHFIELAREHVQASDKLVHDTMNATPEQVRQHYRDVWEFVDCFQNINPLDEYVGKNRPVGRAAKLTDKSVPEMRYGTKIWKHELEYRGRTWEVEQLVHEGPRAWQLRETTGGGTGELFDVFPTLTAAKEWIIDFTDEQHLLDTVDKAQLAVDAQEGAKS